MTFSSILTFKVNIGLPSHVEPLAADQTSSNDLLQCTGTQDYHWTPFLQFPCIYSADHSEMSACSVVARWTWLTTEALHYSDVIWGAMASQITGLTIVYSTVYSGKDQCSASLACVRGIHRWSASNAENVSIWWRHHDDLVNGTKCWSKSAVITPFGCEQSTTLQALPAIHIYISVYTVEN